MHAVGRTGQFGLTLELDPHRQARVGVVTLVEQVADAARYPFGDTQGTHPEGRRTRRREESDKTHHALPAAANGHAQHTVRTTRVILAGRAHQRLLVHAGIVEQMAMQSAHQARRFGSTRRIRAVGRTLGTQHRQTLVRHHQRTDGRFHRFQGGLEQAGRVVYLPFQGRKIDHRVRFARPSGSETHPLDGIAQQQFTLQHFQRRAHQAQHQRKRPRLARTGYEKPDGGQRSRIFATQAEGINHGVVGRFCRAIETEGIPHRARQHRLRRGPHFLRLHALAVIHRTQVG